MNCNGLAFLAGGWLPEAPILDRVTEAMKIGPWVARKRKAFWDSEARFAVAVANCNATEHDKSLSAYH